MKNKGFEIPEYQGCGIYAILNIQEMKCYIGKSSNIKLRATNHKVSLNSNRHANRLLQEDYNNGAEFDFLIICELDTNISEEDLIVLEKLYMLAAIDNCFELYNLIPKTMYEEQKEWIYSHLVWHLMHKNNTSENFIGAFKDKFNTTPRHMNHRCPENRKII